MNYNFNKPDKKISLKKAFREISGIVFTQNEKKLAFVEDEQVQIFLLDLKTKEITKTKNFNDLDPDDNDSEDLVIIEETAYILTAGKNPKIYRIIDYDKENPTCTTHNLEMDSKLNPEGLCHDAENNRLLIACKEALKKSDTKREIYPYDLNTDKKLDKPVLIIDAKDFRKKGKTFHPSAIAIHPITKDYYIIGTRNGKRIVCYDSNGKYKDSQKLDKKLFPKPEGITFSESADLYISTEGENGVKPTIYKFKP